MIQKTHALLACGAVLLVVLLQPPHPVSAASIAPKLADNWPYEIRLWQSEIEWVGRHYKVEPNLIAAIVLAESAGNPTAVSRVGAVGLMGVMPQSDAFSQRPTAEALYDPITNLNWGTSILVEILQQSGGDIHAALAAYNGGWELVSHPVPQGYSKRVVDLYGRAIADRSGIPAEVATRWTIAVEVRNGHIPAGHWLSGSDSVHDLPRYGAHLVHQGIDGYNRVHSIKGYAVPVEYASKPEKYDWLTSPDGVVD